MQFHLFFWISSDLIPEQYEIDSKSDVHPCHANLRIYREVCTRMCEPCFHISLYFPQNERVKF